jgi:mRNA-degrading endonuclease RelE of RelBE toxin-antitoxin system
MPEIARTQTFDELFAQLPGEIQKKVLKAIQLLAENTRYPSLQTKPVEGAPGIYEAQVDRSYRMTYQRLPGDRLLLRVVGKHDEVLKNP